MGLAVDALRAILLEDALNEGTALDLLEDALLGSVDPIEYCVRRLGVPERLAYARAAAWAGLDFVEAVPPDPRGGEVAMRIDALAEARSAVVSTRDGPVTFVTPSLLSLVRFRQAVAVEPGLLRRLRIVTLSALRDHLAGSAAETLMDSARQRLARRWPLASAHLELGLSTRLCFALLVLGLVGIAMLAPFLGDPWLIAASTGIVAAPALLRLAAVSTMPARGGKDPAPPPDVELPHYTVLLPLRNEARMVPQLHRAMTGLDYPPEKLDVIFVVEADSPSTLAAVWRCLTDQRFSLIAVPPARPRTKPKAMNYALPFARGEHVVVYDAEDQPEPDQLRRAAARFHADPDLACLQAELVVENGAETPLAALFAGEYAGLFGIMLPALARWRLPVPLGGTSNHFRALM